MGLNILITVFELKDQSVSDGYLTQFLDQFSLKLTESKPNFRIKDAYHFIYQNKINRPDVHLAVSNNDRFLFFIDVERIFYAFHRLDIVEKITEESKTSAFIMMNSDTAMAQQWSFYKDGERLRNVSMGQTEIEETGMILDYEEPDEDGFNDGFKVLKNFALSFDEFEQLNWRVLKVRDELERSE